MGYSVINPSTNVEAIKQNWKLNHVINLFLLTTSLPFWFFTPFLTREVSSNNWHKFFRFTSISYAIVASGTSLYLATQLGKLKPKIDAINKREQAEFKHSIASDLYLAQSTNTTIAQYLLAERGSSLSSEQFNENELLNSGVHEGFGENKPGVQNSSEPMNRVVQTVQNSSEGELSPLALEHFEDVLDALEDGLSESHIIKNVMGFKNYKYKKGKQVLEEIKRFVELED